MRFSHFLAALAASGVLSSAAHAENVLDIDGKLDKKDAKLTSGEWYENYTFEAAAGSTIVVEMTSDQFDPYLGVHSPSDVNTENDDNNGDVHSSRVEIKAEESGTWTLFATSNHPGEKGKFHLSVDVSEPGVQHISDTIDVHDPKLTSGEYKESWTFQGHAGQLLTADLRSGEFDPYLMIISPSGKHEENDDYEGSSSRSLIAMRLEEEGEYQIIVTTYKPGMTGHYDLALRVQDSDEAGSGDKDSSGALTTDDAKLATGEYVDTYEVEGAPGDKLVIDVASTDFDTYLIVRGAGVSEDNDDGPESGHSHIEVVLPEAGTVKVAVTSYGVGATGDYDLTIDHQAAADTSSNSNDVTRLEPGQTVEGDLSSSDGTLSQGEYVDIYSFDAAAGQSITVDMTATDIDAFLAVILPDGKTIQNDDFAGQGSNSRVQFNAPIGGRYQVWATTYAGGATGHYKVSLSSGAIPDVAPVTMGSGRLHGIFMGIADYPDSRKMNDLDFTDEDAERMYRAMPGLGGMAPGLTFQFVNSDATAANLRASIAKIAADAKPGDMFVFFYSGHGGRVPRASWQPADPDGLDETIELADEAVLDDDFSALLDTLPNGVTSIVLLDSCFSGGFSKDVISKPGRMGMFSSDEDVTSAVAAKFRAGGYLARFLDEGIGDKLADDGDGALTALELSEYVQARYREDVKSNSTDFVQVGANLGYQHVVIDRGSIGAFEVLFRW